MGGKEAEMGGDAGKKSKKGKRREGGGGGSDWPHVSSKGLLSVTPLQGNLLFTVPNFFTTNESRAFIEVAESIGFVHQGSLGPSKGEAYRDNDRISMNDPDLAERIWESGLKNLFSNIQLQGKVAVGLNPNIRVYRYRVGQRFGRHIDESVDLGEGRTTEYTLLIYLTGHIRSKAKNGGSSMLPLVGGETVFYDQRRGVVAEVAPIEGTALVHRHGDSCLLHEARAVTKNVKYVLRSDVVFQRKS